VTLASALTPLPVLIPVGGAALTMFVGRQPRLQRTITLAALAAVVVVCVTLIYLTDQHGTIAVNVGGWGPMVPGAGPLGITLVVDRLSALMMVVSSIVLLAVVLYAIGQGIRDSRCRSSCPRTWCCRPACAARSWPATCSTSSSVSRCC
jgi:multicomponent Na+:H+ antiporter subunit D